MNEGFCRSDVELRKKHSDTEWMTIQKSKRRIFLILLGTANERREDNTGVYRASEMKQ